MPEPVLSASVLMNVSEIRIEDIRWSGSDDQKQVVNRLFERETAYGQWECFHSGLMKSVSGGSNRKEQLIKMRRTRFTLIHRQALFQYLRDSEITGARREAVIRGFHDTTDYMRAVVQEHGRYLQSNSSLFCADHLAYSVLRDHRFTNGLEAYRQKYLDYFSLYCNWIIAENEGAEYPTRRLIPEAKRTLAEMQARLLRMPVVQRLQPSVWRILN